MAGDWIKLEHATPDKPEVVQLAILLDFDDHDLAWAKCVRLWIWADQQSVDGNALTVTDAFIDRYTRVTGFAAALRKVGWLEGRDGRLSIPDFARHNGQSAKTRASTQKRVKKSREKRNDRVTPEALPEKRREEKSNNKQTNLQSEHLKEPEFAEVFAAMVQQSRANHAWRCDEIVQQSWLMELGRHSLEDAIGICRFTISAGAKKPILNGDHKRSETRRGGRSKASGLESVGL
jgi:hypothetical protein